MRVRGADHCHGEGQRGWERVRTKSPLPSFSLSWQWWPDSRLFCPRTEQLRARGRLHWPWPDFPIKWQVGPGQSSCFDPIWDAGPMGNGLSAVTQWVLPRRQARPCLLASYCPHDADTAPLRTSTSPSRKWERSHVPPSALVGFREVKSVLAEHRGELRSQPASPASIHQSVHLASVCLQRWLCPACLVRSVVSKPAGTPWPPGIHMPGGGGP